MTLQLFAHPFSSYCQKVLVAFYEKAIWDGRFADVIPLEEALAKLA